MGQEVPERDVVSAVSQRRQQGSLGWLGGQVRGVGVDELRPVAELGSNGGETAVESQLALLYQLECRDGGNELGA